MWIMNNFIILGKIFCFNPTPPFRQEQVIISYTNDRTVLKRQFQFLWLRRGRLKNLWRFDIAILAIMFVVR